MYLGIDELCPIFPCRSVSCQSRALESLLFSCKGGASAGGRSLYWMNLYLVRVLPPFFGYWMYLSLGFNKFYSILFKWIMSDFTCFSFSSSIVLSINLLDLWGSSTLNNWAFRYLFVGLILCTYIQTGNRRSKLIILPGTFSIENLIFDKSLMVYLLTIFSFYCHFFG